MTLSRTDRAANERALSARDVLSRAFTRAVGSEVVPGNEVLLLRDGKENYPAWLEAIAAAEHHVHFENYIIRDDAAGNEVADALVAKAKSGVRVRLLHDWLGALGKTPDRFWRRLADAGVEVRAFNPLRLASPLGWVHRDHRKMLSADGRVAFVTGLCVGNEWVGDPERGIEPWRDTGVRLRGPAVTHVEHAFARAWAHAGAPIPDGETASGDDAPPAGDVAVRVVAGEPWGAGLLRLGEVVASAAQRTLWLTDAYFGGTPSFVQGLRAAARDGVDVRLLVPGASDIPFLKLLSRAGYRPLLEAGVRVFEWRGPMIHAKTAVADGLWARVGSSNLNLASWIGNFELDVVVENAPFAAQVERMDEEDLANSTELVLSATPRRRVQHAVPSDQARGRAAQRARRTRQATAGAIRLGHTVGAALTSRRKLEPTDARSVALGGIAALALGVVVAVWPWIVALPIAFIAAWIGGALLAKAFGLFRQRRAAATAERARASSAPSP